ncbi:MAG: hypothetical protein JOZ03_13545, partial [Gammaproteobacteria bacterium]|nr:hypothetical protein [Gammaproteobacteria bacterium]
FERAKRGYARGWEPVQFVDRIQRYLTLLAWQPGDAPSGGTDHAGSEPVPSGTVTARGG